VPVSRELPDDGVAFHEIWNTSGAPAPLTATEEVEPTERELAVPPIGAKDVFVMMSLCTRDGASKLVRTCTYPLTGRACVSRLYTDHGVIDVGPDGPRVRSTYVITLDELRQRTGLPLLRH
jgi:hypothetical protein